VGVLVSQVNVDDLNILRNGPHITLQLRSNRKQFPGIESPEGGESALHHKDLTCGPGLLIHCFYCLIDVWNDLSKSI
jgi:hypothetical protein